MACKRVREWLGVEMLFNETDQEVDHLKPTERDAGHRKATNESKNEEHEKNSQIPGHITHHDRKRLG